MTGERPTGIPPPTGRSRRAQLQKMLNLQRKLDSLKACNCPEDCHGQGRDPVPEWGRRNTGRGNPPGSNFLLGISKEFQLLKQQRSENSGYQIKVLSPRDEDNVENDDDNDNNESS